MKLPRGLTGAQLVKALAALGYRVTRQTGSHVRLTCPSPTPHHLTVPAHDPLRVGALAGILADVGTHHKLSRKAVIERLFGS